MTVIDVFQGGLLTQFGVLEQAFEPPVIPIGLLILGQQPNKLGMGEVCLTGAIEPVFKASGHAEELHYVESVYGLLIEHGFPPHW
jgi:hypothetical protein